MNGPEWPWSSTGAGSYVGWLLIGENSDQVRGTDRTTGGYLHPASTAELGVFEDRIHLDDSIIETIVDLAGCGRDRRRLTPLLSCST